MSDDSEVPFTVGCAKQIAVNSEKFNAIDEKMDTILARFETLSAAIKCQRDGCETRLDNLEKFQDGVTTVGKVGGAGLSIGVGLTVLWRFFFS